MQSYKEYQNQQQTIASPPPPPVNLRRVMPLIDEASSIADKLAQIMQNIPPTDPSVRDLRQPINELQLKLSGIKNFISQGTIR